MRREPPPEPNTSTNTNINPPPTPHRTLIALVVVAPGPGVFSNLGPEPQLLVCPYCNKQIVTMVKTEPNRKTRMCALGLSVLCLFFCIPCCFLPFCLDTCQSRNHYCSNCGEFLGTYNVREFEEITGCC